MPNGDVRACCQNVWHPLGNVTSQPLRAIWDGAAAAALRDRLARGDLGLGCELCQVEVRAGAEHAAHLHAYDELEPTDPELRWPGQLELTLSIACNLQCQMCNGELSSAIRIHREHRPPPPRPFDERFFAELEPFLLHADRIAFLGGEPFLGPEPLRVLDQLVAIGSSARVHIITNGTQWSERIGRILGSLPVHLAVSVDGATAPTNEAIRVGVDHRELQVNLERLRAATRRPGSGLSLAFSLMTANWHELADVLAWGDRLECDVAVNTVTNPPRFSLRMLGPADLALVDAGLAERDGWCEANLGRNLPVWHAARRHVAALAAAAVAARTDGVSFDGVMAATRAWAGGGPVVVMEADESLVVTRIGPDPADVFGFDARPVVGSTSMALMRGLGPTLGELVGTDVDLATPGVERRTFSFERGGVRRTVLATMVRRPLGEVWALALRDDSTVQGDALAPAGQPVSIRR